MSDASESDTESEQTEAQQHPLAAVLGRNTIFSYLGRFRGLGIAFFLTPYVCDNLADKPFGVSTLLAMPTGHAAFVSAR